jgi:hypothetical protein
MERLLPRSVTAESGALRGGIETITERLWPDRDRREEGVVLGITRHRISSTGPKLECSGHGRELAGAASDKSAASAARELT